jgi:hypothetical protein
MLWIVLSVDTDLSGGATARSSKSVLEIANVGAWAADTVKSRVSCAIGIRLSIAIVLSIRESRE